MTNIEKYVETSSISELRRFIAILDGDLEQSKAEAYGLGYGYKRQQINQTMRQLTFANAELAKKTGTMYAFARRGVQLSMAL